MKMRRMMAVKPHKYGTRHLIAGDEYEVPARHALALLASKKARFAADGSPPLRKPTPPVPVHGQPEPAAVATESTTEIYHLRNEADRLGIEVDGRWGMARLQYEITKAASGVKDAVSTADH